MKDLVNKLAKLTDTNNTDPITVAMADAYIKLVDMTKEQKNVSHKEADEFATWVVRNDPKGFEEMVKMSVLANN